MKYPDDSNFAANFRAFVREITSLPVVAEACWVSDFWGQLHPQEQALVHKALTPRRQQFATGRVLAKHCVSQLGVECEILGMNIDRIPAWPRSVVGSISHGDEACIVVAANKSDISTIGIDIENRAPLSTDLWHLIFCTQEKKWLHSLPDSERDKVAMVMFSAKESYYKAQYTVMKARLSFTDISIELDETSCVFHVSPLRSDGTKQPVCLSGSFRFYEQWIWTAIIVPAYPPRL